MKKLFSNHSPKSIKLSVFSRDPDRQPHKPYAQSGWQFGVDRGGIFTDLVAQAPRRKS